MNTCIYPLVHMLILRPTLYTHKKAKILFCNLLRPFFLAPCRVEIKLALYGVGPSFGTFVYHIIFFGGKLLPAFHNTNVIKV